MRLLITGGCGFLGSNLAAEALRLDKEVFIFDNLSRSGSRNNLEWLGKQGKFQFYKKDIRLAEEVNKVVKDIKPDIVFHLAGQVAMTTSLEDPWKDFEVNVIGSLNLLESLRKFSPEAQTLYSSTNKVYGDLEKYEYIEKETRYEVKGLDYGFDESTELDFISPYGCSKGAADQYMLDYSRNFGLQNIVFRHSSIFGDRQFSTFDQGWVGWFIRQALIQKKDKSAPLFTVSGNGKQVRDVLFTSDLISCYFSAVDNFDKSSGEAFNIGGGMQNSLSLLELLTFLEEELDTGLKFEQAQWRSNDQKIFVADTRKAESFFKWFPKKEKNEGLKEMIRWVQDNEL